MEGPSDDNNARSLNIEQTLDSFSPPWLEFLLSDENLSTDKEFMDAATLSAVCNAIPSTSAVGPSCVAVSKRSNPIQDDDGSEESEDEGRKDDGSRGPCAKKAKHAEAAKTKACKEKIRRGKINDRFSTLAALIEPGKDPKTDKPAILADAIKFVQQITAENHQLKMLNKFLEERVAHFEREKGQALYHQSLVVQGMGSSPHMISQGTMHSGVSTVGMPAPQLMHGQQQILMQPSTMAGMPSFQGAAPSSSMYVAPQPQPAHMQMLQPPMQSHPQLFHQPQMEQPVAVHQVQYMQPQQQQQHMQQQPFQQLQHQPQVVQQQLQQQPQQPMQQQQQQQLQEQQVQQQQQQMQRQYSSPPPLPQQQRQQPMQQQLQDPAQDTQQWQQPPIKQEPMQDAMQRQPSPALNQPQPSPPPVHMPYMIGLKPAAGLPHHGMLPSAQVTAVPMQQPNWVNSNMLDAAQDSLLRPPVA